MRRIGSWACVLAAACLAGCGGGGGGADGGAPPPELKVSVASFVDGATDVDPRKPVIVSFDSAVAGGGIGASQVQLTRAGVATPVTVTSASGTGIVIQPLVPLRTRSDYRLVIKAGARGDNGATLRSDYVLNFRTSPFLLETRALVDRGSALGVQSVAAQDVDDDGRPDLVVLGRSVTEPNSSAAYSLWIHRQNAAGGLELLQRLDPPSVSFTGSAHFGAVILLDIDGDGLPEILVPEWAPCATGCLPGIQIYKRGSDGLFAPQPLWSSKYFRTVQVLDVNGDGRPDLVTRYSQQNDGHGSGFQIHLNLRSGLQSLTPVDMPLERGAGEMAAVDLDRDGKPELLMLAGSNQPSGPQLATERWVYQVSASGTLSRDPALEDVVRGLCAGLQFCEGQHFIDIDGDGWQDVIYANADDFQTLAYLRQPGAGFSRGFHYVYGLGIKSVVVADLDGDGLKDILIAEVTNAFVAAGLGRRAVDFEYSEAFEVPMGAAASSEAFAVVDFDRDGRQDVVFITNEGSVVLMRQPGY